MMGTGVRWGGKRIRKRMGMGDQEQVAEAVSMVPGKRSRG